MYASQYWVAGILGLNLLCGSVAEAQPAVGRTRVLLGEDREAYIRENLPLGTEEGRIFWPLYERYRDDVGYVIDRAIILFEELALRYPTLTDVDADELLDEALAVQQEEVDVRTKWARRMREDLPARTVARFFQLESQLSALVKAEIADSMPLVKTEPKNETLNPPRNPLRDDRNRIRN